MEKQNPAAAPPPYDASGAQYPPQGPPPAGYPSQGPPPAGYPAQGPPPAGYPAQAPPPAGYPAHGPPPAGYPAQGPPPAGYPQPYPQAAVTVAPMSNTVVIQQGVHMLGESPANMTCPHCQAQIVTRIDYETGLLAWLIVGVLFLVGLWLCCFIPLCINDCKDVIHYCPNCNRQVGRKNRM